MNIRRASLNDLERLYQIEKRCFQNTESSSKEKLKERIKNLSYFFVLEKDKNIIAYVNGLFSDEEEFLPHFYQTTKSKDTGANYFLLTIACDKKYQHHGYGTLLINYIHQILRQEQKESVYLYCKENRITFYEQFGYRCNRTKEINNQTWYEMKYHLKGNSK